MSSLYNEMDSLPCGITDVKSDGSLQLSFFEKMKKANLKYC